MSGEKKMAHCTLCHADFVMTFAGNGGHACPFAFRSTADDDYAIVIATSGFGCAACDRAAKKELVH